MNLDDLRAAARQVPFRQPTPALRDALRDALIDAASAAPPSPRRRRARTAAGLALLAAAASLALWLSPGVRATLFDAASRSALDVGQPRATVHAAIGADVEHTRRLRRDHPVIGVDEVVRVREGHVAVSVEPHRPSERIRVLAGEVEVQVLAVEVAASFHVAVEQNRLIEIRLESGRAALHFPDQESIELEPGGTWQSTGRSVAREPVPPPRTTGAQPGAAGPLPASPPSTAGPARRGAGVRASIAEDPPDADPTPRFDEPANLPPPPIAGPATASERAFGQGFRALRGGHHVEAADRLSQAIRGDPGGPLAADARYWRAVALGRAGQARKARRALADFLAHHPASARSGAASVMLGWLLLEAGDRNAAARRFRAAAADRDPAVRSSAAKGLAAAADRAPRRP